jgi:hypothetical protein
MILESPQLLVPGVEFSKLSTATKDTPRQLESQEGFPLAQKKKPALASPKRA